jgi:hypothetical protein
MHRNTGRYLEKNNQPQITTCETHYADPKCRRLPLLFQLESGICEINVKETKFPV